MEKPFILIKRYGCLCGFKSAGDRAAGIRIHIAKQSIYVSEKDRHRMVLI